MIKSTHLPSEELLRLDLLLESAEIDVENDLLINPLLDMQDSGVNIGLGALVVMLNDLKQQVADDEADYKKLIVQARQAKLKMQCIESYLINNRDTLDLQSQGLMVHKIDDFKVMDKEKIPEDYMLEQNFKQVNTPKIRLDLSQNAEIEIEGVCRTKRLKIIKI